MAGNFDLLVLGAGSGGYACALRAAQLGLRVGLVEQDLVGGTCLHRGCIPTKAILHAAEVADAARSGAQVGVHATIDKIDLAAVTAYAESVVGRLYKGLSGGVIGCEFASAWRSFGVDVTIVEALPRLLAAEEPAVSAALERAFRKRGITVVTGAALESAVVESGGVRLTLAKERTLSAELLLVAVGRGPVSDGLGYAEAGVRL